MYSAARAEFCLFRLSEKGNHHGRTEEKYAEPHSADEYSPPGQLPRRYAELGKATERNDGNLIKKGRARPPFFISVICYRTKKPTFFCTFCSVFLEVLNAFSAPFFMQSSRYALSANTRLNSACIGASISATASPTAVLKSP